LKYRTKKIARKQHRAIKIRNLLWYVSSSLTDSSVLGSILVELGISFSGPGYNNCIVEARHGDVHAEYTRRSSRGSTKGSGDESHYTIRFY
jgi:hypothetical protein